MKLDTGKTTVISFTRKTNSIKFTYKLFNNQAARSLCAKYFGILLDCKLYFLIHYLLHYFTEA
jgi:hypothetical protein